MIRLQDEAIPCRQRIASYPDEIQGMRVAMGRNQRFRSELAAGFEAEKDKANLDWRRALECLDRRRDVSFAERDHRHRELQRAVKELEESVLSCRSREAAAKARVSLHRELASAETLRAHKWPLHRAYLGGGMRLPAQSRTLRWSPLRWTSPATPRKRRTVFSRPPDFVVEWTSSVD